MSRIPTPIYSIICIHCSETGSKLPSIHERMLVSDFQVNTDVLSKRAFHICIEECMSRVISLRISILDHSNIVTCTLLFQYVHFAFERNLYCSKVFGRPYTVFIDMHNYHPSITVCSCQAVRVNTDVSTTYNYSRCVIVTLVSSRVILIQIDVAIKCNLCSSNAF